MLHHVVAMFSFAGVHEATEIAVLVEWVKVLFHPAGNWQRAIGFAGSVGAEEAFRREEEGPRSADFFCAVSEFAFVEADEVSGNSNLLVARGNVEK